MDMIFTNPKKEYKKFSGGFTILYAILITTIVLSIGLSLLSVLIQQVSLSGTERESALSSYVADSGLECALYWDIAGGDAFRNATPVTCDGQSPLAPGVTKTTAPLSPPQPSFVNETYVFRAMFPNGCAKITLIKTVDTASNLVATTTVQSRGYNTTCPPTASLKPWRLERGFQTTY